MVKIPIDSKLDFDYSVGTEDRFALRNWFERLVKAINYNDAGDYEPQLSERLSVEGFTPEPLNHETYIRFLKDRVKQKPIRVLRFPELKVRYKHFFYHLVGTYEEFIDGILAYEGTIELAVLKEEDVFKLESIKFYPRLRVQLQ
jgi:hypothetical protein